MFPKQNRILWNERPDEAGRGGCIDEIVVERPESVHVEQLDTRQWWIGIEVGDGKRWSGVFIADSRGRMKFTEQESEITWDRDEEHA